MDTIPSDGHPDLTVSALTVADLPEGTPLWLILIVVLIPSLLTFSEKAASIAGPLGSAARWWQTRQKRAIERDASITAARLNIYEAELQELHDIVEDLRTRITETETRHREQRAYDRSQFARELEAAVTDRDLYADWSAYQARWWRPQNQWLAEQGIVLPPPPYPAFTDFRSEWLKDREISTR